VAGKFKGIRTYHTLGIYITVEQEKGGIIVGPVSQESGAKHRWQESGAKHRWQESGATQIALIIIQAVRSYQGTSISENAKQLTEQIVCILYVTYFHSHFIFSNPGYD
jgi:hypothetical protein